MRIMLIDSDQRNASYLKRGLSENSFSVDVVLPENIGAPSRDYALLIADTGSFSQPIPISPIPTLYLLSNGESGNSYKNYLRKPFSFTELLHQVRALVGQAHQDSRNVLTVADLELDLLRRRASRGSRRLDLTPKEFLLLSLLMCRSGEVLSRTLISDQVWDINFDSATNFVAVHIRRLRAKVDDPFDVKLIHTVRGVGYVLEERTAEPASIPASPSLMRSFARPEQSLVSLS